MTALGPGAEFDLIRRIAALPGAAGLGDDCAVLDLGDGVMVLSTDASVEHVHFEREWIDAEEIGWRATAAALSDIAAMGAAPAGVLVALTVPRPAPPADVEAVMRGAAASAAAAGTAVLGGDLSAGGEWNVAVTAVGRAPRPVLRSGAHDGDRLWVTGTLGGARAAVRAWADGKVPPPVARTAFARPVPRLAEGRWLAAHGATALMDISDGLAGDAAHLAAASGVRLGIVLDRVPVHAACVEDAVHRGEDPVVGAAIGGEDYELLVTLPASFGEDEVRAFEQAHGLALTRIGAVSAGSGVRCTLRGVRMPLPGFSHF